MLAQIKISVIAVVLVCTDLHKVGVCLITCFSNKQSIEDLNIDSSHTQ